MKIFKTGECPEICDAPPFLIDQLWAYRGVGILSGPPKLGKSWLALHIAICVASGKPVLDRYAVSEAGTVLLLSPEGGVAELEKRIASLCAGLNVDQKSLPLYIVDTGYIDLWGNKLHKQKWLKAIEEYNPTLCILDPLSRIWSGDENTSQHVNQLANFFIDVQEMGTATMIVHHSSKKGEMRGSSALFAIGESYLFLSAPEGEDAEQGKMILNTEQKNARAIRKLSLYLTKDNDVFRLVLEEEKRDKKILEFLSKQNVPVSARKIRDEVKGSFHDFPRHLKSLVTAGKIEQKGKKYSLKKKMVL